MLTRLNKFLAHAGVCSRREADRWIAEGRINVNGRVVFELGEKIDPARDRVQANGKPVRAEEEKPLYILLNKPAGRVVSVKDPFGRPTVMDLLKRLNRDRGIAFVFSTHDPRILAAADRVVHLADGRIAS